MAPKEKIKVGNKTKPTTNQFSTRPPVVAILGHVDHGKTSLLDYIRKTRVAEKEFGGITQHIGAYQIEHADRQITFIDTPGHEAFSAMRARGGQVSDIAVLVVAADDGVMPQTRESIAHIKAAGVPFLVAINKIDLPGVSIERVKKQLAEADVLVEGYGGDVVIVPVSAKTGQGVDELLEMINLLADLHELKENKSALLLGVVIEAKLDKLRGPVATILVKEGILKIGDPISTQTVVGKVKSLLDSNGNYLREASPSTPVEVLGFSRVPKVGEVVKNFPDGPIQKEERPEKLTIKEKIAQINKNEIRLIIKADVVGSLEAIINSLESLKKETQQVKIYYAESGEITEGDVLLAAATRAIIIGFNVSINSSVERLASEEKVLIRKYNLIYDLLDELKEGLEALSERKVEEESLGEAEIIEIFRVSGSKVAGCRVTSGRINRADTLILKRQEKEVAISKIVSMKHRESDINEATESQEFGATFEKDVPFTKGDIIVAISHS